MMRHEYPGIVLYRSRMDISDYHRASRNDSALSQKAPELTHSRNKQSTTRLPPAGKTNSLVGNGDTHSQRRHQSSDRNNSLSGKQNGVIAHQNNNRINNDNKHRSTITKQRNDVTVTPSNRVHHQETNADGERMSNGSRNSNQIRTNTDMHRNYSPKTDSTEYRIRNPRNVRKEHGNLMSPRTETSSESRGRSKEFAFRWNAPSRNTSPDATEKSSSPPLKQFKPSARIQSFYAFLNGRKKAKQGSESIKNQKQKGILTPNTHRNDVDKDRPNTFVYLRSKTVQRSAWDKEPGQLTYKPSTNGPEEISHAYVGEDSIREAEMNAKLQQIQQRDKSNGKENKNTLQKRSTKNPPWYENEYVLNRRQAGVYRNMSNTYGKESKRQREQRFVQRLADYEVNKAKQQWEELLEKARKKRESKDRQTLQLNELRQRFEDEAYHRFHTQYVTSRVLEHEKMNRTEYGLPEDDAEEPENKAVIKRKKIVPKSLITEDMIQDIYKKKFNKMFAVNKGQGMGKRPKTPKMEGIDTVVLQEEDKEGNVKEKKFMVKNVIDDAKKQVNNNKQKSRKPSSPLVKDEIKNESNAPMNDVDLDDDSDDDDMDDIFEKARRKYDLDVD